MNDFGAGFAIRVRYRPCNAVTRMPRRVCHGLGNVDARWGKTLLAFVPFRSYFHSIWRRVRESLIGSSISVAMCVAWSWDDVLFSRSVNGMAGCVILPWNEENSQVLPC